MNKLAMLETHRMANQDQVGNARELRQQGQKGDRESETGSSLRLPAFAAWKWSMRHGLPPSSGRKVAQLQLDCKKAGLVMDRNGSAFIGARSFSEPLVFPSSPFAVAYYNFSAAHQESWGIALEQADDDDD